MPELPEVETVRRGLIPAMEGHLIREALLRRTDFRHPAPADLAERIRGARIERIGRRSKYLLFDLSTGETMILHLGMSGRILIGDTQIGTFHFDAGGLGQHDHFAVVMDTGTPITFNDARRFGSLDLTPTTEVEAHWLLAGIGPEPLGNLFDQEHLARVLQGRKTPIKAALLDQRLIAGLGNIYVNEALWRSHIHPARLAGDVRAAEIPLLHTAIRAVLDEAIAAGGSSLRDHRQTNGELGYFQKAHAAYDRGGEPCRTPGCTGTIERVVQSGRSSYFCPVCQS